MMKRGEIWWVNFDPSIGGEIKKTRPAIIISNDAANKHLNRVQVVPLTSVVKKLYPAECLIDIQSKQSKAMADQIMTVSKQRMTSKISTITNDELMDLERCVCVQLGLKSAVQH